MEEKTKRQIEKYEADYDKIASKDVWEPCDITLMKDLQKLMYYLEVRCAMKDGDDYPGSDYMPDIRSYARGRSMPNRNPMNGRFMSGDGRSMRYPYYGDDWETSGRKYYDSEKEKAIHKLHHMMEMEDNPEKKNALQLAVNALEMSK